VDIAGALDVHGALGLAETATVATNKKIQFRDTAIHISSPADGDLAIAADDEIDITSTLIDVNGNLDVSGTTVSAGKITGGTGAGRKLFLGDYTSTSSGAPTSLSLGARFSNSAGGKGTLKLQLWENATDTTDSGYNVMGIGVSSNQIDYVASDDAYHHNFFVGTTERLKIQSDAGNNVVVADGLTLTNGNLIVASGHGINFSSYGSGTNIDNNLLNDYEEGTWTPACTMFTIASTPLATYTKIGNVVNIFCYIEIQNNSGNSSTVRMTGLPFTAKNQHYATGVMNLASANGTINNPHVRTVSNNTFIDFKKDNDTSLIANLVDHAHVLFSVTYFTDS